MLRFLTSGESHGPQLTGILDGMPAGLSIDIEKINYQLARRQKGHGRGGRMKIEKDRAEILSGLRYGLTMGGPITLVIENKDWKNWTKVMDPHKAPGDDLGLKEKKLAYDTTAPRPGHADLAGAIKWNHHDMRNVLERASARETAARVAVGSIGRQLLEQFDVIFASHVVSIGEVSIGSETDYSDLVSLAARAEESEVRSVDEAAAKEMMSAIDEAKKSRDSLGGIVELIVRGLPVGLGGLSQWSDRLDGRLAQSLMSIQSVKGVEIGAGFGASRQRGSEVHDEIFYDPKGDATKKKFYRKTNRAGGLEGGMTNGEDIVVRIGCKPISTLNRPLQTVNVRTKEAAEAMVERTDNCVVPALAVICEAAAAIVLAEAFLAKFGADNMAETRQNFEAYLKTDF